MKFETFIENNVSLDGLPKNGAVIRLPRRSLFESTRRDIRDSVAAHYRVTVKRGILNGTSELPSDIEDEYR